MSTMICRHSVSLFCVIALHVTAFVTSFNVINGKFAEKETDSVALLAIKSKIIHDPQGILNSWNDSRHFCEWDGITCGRRHRRVTVLDLNSRGLFGSLSPYIGNLSFLRVILLFNNSIQGGIPPEIGRLFRLQNLRLGNNSLVGEILGSLSHCSWHIGLSLFGNKLVGKIPPEIASLHNLLT